MLQNLGPEIGKGGLHAGEGEIKAVTFDIGGTLAKGRLNQRVYTDKVTSYLQSRGFHLDLKDLLKATSKALEELRLKRKDQLEMSFREFCSKILLALGITPSEELVGAIRSLYYECFPQTEREGARKILVELSKSYSLGAISNSMSLAPKRFLEETRLSRYFKSIVISGEVGYRKPHPEIFKRALGELGVDPREAVHVGNLLEEDVKGAKSAGMYSVLVTPKGIEGAEVEPDVAVPSLNEVPWAVETLSSPKLREFKELLGGKCTICFSKGVCLYPAGEGGEEEVDRYVLLCPDCRKETLKPPPKVRKHGKYRAIYRKAWLEAHIPKRVLP